jgi:hypothetical protein
MNFRNDRSAGILLVGSRADLFGFQQEHEQE